MKPSEFVSLVVKQYKSGVGIFKKKINAEELLPMDANDLTKALYIFYVLQLDYAMKSQILYSGALRLYNDNDKFFTPNFLIKVTDDVLQMYLKDYLHPRYVNEAVKRYRVNSQTLLEKYDGDPRKLFTVAKTCKEVIEKIKDFRGFGPKIGNFFVRTMINTFNYQYDDLEDMLPPVDVHDVRIAYLLGYTNSDEMSQKNITFVKKVWNQACLDSGESWLVFDKALWLLGSEGKPKSREDIISLLY